jgi:membrane associated rhomboid family serine protease
MTFTALIVIIGITSLISLHAFSDNAIFERLLFSPYRIKHHKEYYRLLSNVLVHSDLIHLIFNMLSLFFLGEALEYFFFRDMGIQIGEIHFLAVYILGGLASNIYAYYRHQDDPNYRAVGASGAVSSVIFAAILWAPDMELMLFFIPIPIPAYLFGPIYLAFEYFGHKRGGTRIAHDAHIGGAIFGVLYVLIINIDKGKEFISHFF